MNVLGKCFPVFGKYFPIFLVIHQLLCLSFCFKDKYPTMNYLNMRQYLSLISMGMLLFASGCSDDKETPELNFTEKIFNSSNGLEILYNGVEMPGKTVSVKRVGDKAEISSFSIFDMSQLSALGLSGELPCPGIIPGSPETVWEVPITEKDGVYSFSGKDENNFCSYSFYGEISSDRLMISIVDPVLKNHPLSDIVWKPAPIKEDAASGITSLPFYVDWEIDPIAGIDIDLSPLLESLTVLPIIPVYDNTAYMSLSQALEQIVQATTFKADGNILFTYISTVGGAAHLAQTQPNGLQYTLSGSDVLKLYVNPLSLFGFIIENTSGGTAPEDVDLNDKGLFPSGNSRVSSGTSNSGILSSPLSVAMIKGVMGEILPLLSTGIPLKYTVIDNHLEIYIDTEESLTLLNTIIDSFLQNDEAVKALVAQLKQNPGIAPLLEDLPKLQETVTQSLLNTTKLRIGFNWIKQ